MKRNINSRIGLQGGAVLVTSLVFMAILTVIAVATMRSTTTDINILNNMQSRNNAFQCAEAALRAGEIWLDEKITSVPERVTTLPDQSLNSQVWDYKADAIRIFQLKTMPGGRLMAGLMVMHWLMQNTRSAVQKNRGF